MTTPTGEKRMISFEELMQDLKYALRAIRRSPGYAGLVVLTLAFGIAANTTMHLNGRPPKCNNQNHKIFMRCVATWGSVRLRSSSKCLGCVNF